MKKSEHIYNKFKSMFLIGDGENFAAVSLFDMINVDTFNFVPDFLQRSNSMFSMSNAYWQLITIVHSLFHKIFSGVC